MKTRIIKLAAVIGFLAMICGSMNVWAAEEEKPTASANVAFLSKYVWRGYEMTRDSLVIQPAATVSYKGVSVGLWGNLDTNPDVTGGTNPENWTETDLTLSYDKSFGMVNLGVGYIYYGNNGALDGQDIYLSVGLKTLLAPTLKIYREIGHFPQWYLSFGVSHSFELSQGITLDLAGSVAYNASDDEDMVKINDNLTPTTDKYSAFHDGLISVGLTIPVGKYFKVVPMIAYSFPLSNDAKNLIQYTNAYSNDSDYVFGGVTVSMSF